MSPIKRKRPQDLEEHFYQQCQQQFQREPSNKIIKNAVNTVGITYATVNNECLHKHNYRFDITLRAKHAVATNQHQTGRCWMFAGLNVLRHQVMTKLSLETNLEFSETHLFFWDKLERINCLLENIILYNIKPRTKLMDSLLENLNSDGGWWNYFANLVSKYGLIPVDAMPKTYQSERSREMNALLRYQLFTGINKIYQHQQQSLSEKRKIKEEILQQVYNTLVKCLGQPPKTFSWTFKQSDVPKVTVQDLTPHSFYNLIMNIVNLEIPESSENSETPENPDDQEQPKVVTLDQLLTTINKHIEKIDAQIVDLDELKCTQPTMSLDDFVVLASLPIKQKRTYGRKYDYTYNKVYQIKWVTNISNRPVATFLNLEIAQLKEYARKSILEGFPVWFAADIDKDYSPLYAVLDPQLYQKSLAFTTDTTFSKGDRLLLGELSANHAMCLTGFTVIPDKEAKEDNEDPVDALKTAPIDTWQVENSWGYYYRHHPGLDGFLSMSDTWFTDYVIEVVVPKKILSRYHRNLWENQRQYKQVEPWNYVTSYLKVDGTSRPADYLQGHFKN